MGLARGTSGEKRDAVLKKIAPVLAEDGLRLKIVDFSGLTIRNLYERLEPEIPDEAGVALVITGLESAVFAPEGDLFLRVLNLDRDRFRRNFTIPILFWLSPAAADRLQADAHDFYDYWTGLFDFSEHTVDSSESLEHRFLKTVNFQFFVASTNEEKQFLEDEIGRHRTIVASLMPLEKITAVRSRQRAIDSLRILARDEARLGRVDDAGSYIAQMYTLMPDLQENTSESDTPELSKAAGTADAAASSLRSTIREWADYADWLSEQIGHENGVWALSLIADRYDSLKKAAVWAINRAFFPEALSLLKPIIKYLDSQRMYAEFDNLADIVHCRVNFIDGAPPEPDTDAGALWFFMESFLINRLTADKRLNEAEEASLYIRDILEPLSSNVARGHLAATYLQLGSIALIRKNLDQAEEWYKKSLAMSEAIGDASRSAGAYGWLGYVAIERGELDQAAVWYQKYLEISEARDSHHNPAIGYYELGIIAKARGDLGRAEKWLKKSLETNLTRGIRTRAATSLYALGLLAEEKGRMQEALDWTVQCIGLFDEFPHPSAYPAPKLLARLTRQLGLPALEAAWQRCHEMPLPDAVRQGIGEL